MWRRALLLPLAVLAVTRSQVRSRSARARDDGTEAALKDAEARGDDVERALGDTGKAEWVKTAQALLFAKFQRMKPRCYIERSRGSRKGSAPKGVPDNDYRLVILSSRRHLIRTSYATWMRLLPKGAPVSLIMDHRLYKAEAPLWDLMPFDILSFDTSENKTSYARAGEVFNLGLAHAAASMESWKESWLVIVDDDTWVNPLLLGRVLAARNPLVPHFLGDNRGDCHPFCGGSGMALSRAALRGLNTMCLRQSYACDPEATWGDVTFGAAVGLNQSSWQGVLNPEPEPSAEHLPITVHPCREDECFEGNLATAIEGLPQAAVLLAHAAHVPQPQLLRRVHVPHGCT